MCVVGIMLGAKISIRTESSLTAIVILALVALFIGLRLYSVLGERTGHEQPILKPADPEADARHRAAGCAAHCRACHAERAGRACLSADCRVPAFARCLRRTRSFDVARFLEGSKSAYRLILEAFWKGDLEAMKPFVDAHVFETFAGAVEQRTKDGLVLDNRLVAIDQAVIAGAELERSVALVTVRFEADIAAVTRNAAGEVVAGSLSDAVQTRDRWTFRRDISLARSQLAAGRNRRGRVSAALRALALSATLLLAACATRRPEPPPPAAGTRARACPDTAAAARASAARNRA